MNHFDAESVQHFDPMAVAGFGVEHIQNFDPTAMGGFGADQFHNFDPMAVAGFGVEHIEHFDPNAMGGFGAEQIQYFDPTSMKGFAREHMTHMELGALSAFDISQVKNLDKQAIAGIGDTVPEFGDFDVEVRFEVVGEEALRLGGVGSFAELAVQIAEGPSPEALEAMGWDPSMGVDYEEFDLSMDILEGLTGEALDRAIEAFGALEG